MKLNKQTIAKLDFDKVKINGGATNNFCWNNFTLTLWDTTYVGHPDPKTWIQTSDLRNIITGLREHGDPEPWYTDNGSAQRWH